MNHDQILKDLIKNLPVEFVKGKRWFQQKQSVISAMELSDALRLNDERLPARYLGFVTFSFEETASATYAMFFLLDDKPPCTSGHPVLAGRIEGGAEYFLMDGDKDVICLSALSRLWNTTKTQNTSQGNLTINNFIVRQSGTTVFSESSSNTLYLAGQKEIIKLFRRVNAGINPEAEVLAYLNVDPKADYVPSLTGTIAYKPKGGQEAVLAIKELFLENFSTSWEHFTDRIKDLYASIDPLFAKARPSLQEIDFFVHNHSSSDFREMDLMGATVARLHLALSGLGTEKTAYPKLEVLLGEIIKKFRSADTKYAEICGKSSQVFREGIISPKESIGKLEDLLRRFKDAPLGLSIRIHGDLHLGQVLRATDGCFKIIDFEGEPCHSLAERRMKYSPFKDIAGMIRSFNYARYAVLFSLNQEKMNEMQRYLLLSVGKSWEAYALKAFLAGYYSCIETSDIKLVPEEKNARSFLLSVFMLDKAFYELDYEVNNRPGWVEIPIAGIRDCLRLLSTESFILGNRKASSEM